MNDPTPNPPLSSTSQNQPQDTLLQRGAFDPPFNPGTLGRLNRFEIIRLLGEGSMGQVYLAREPLTDTHVAVKIMKPQLADDPQAVHRFLTEARHMYRLSHPRILRVLEVSDRKEGAYYIMPYIAGGNLIAQCKPGEPMPAERIATIARQVAEALAHAHAHGLIHRDIKPGNILLDKEGNAFLTDFGLVRTVFNDSMVDATASHLEGTAPYMSPAVARGEAEDTRCDIYAFGAVLYELLTGQPPYTGRTPQMILDQILRGPPLPIRQINPKANPALAKIAEGCMARELRDRYASMADVVTDLARAAQGATPRGQHPQQSRLPKLAVLLVGALSVIILIGVILHSFMIKPAARPRKETGAKSGALTRAGFFGFPQTEAQVLCDIQMLRVSVWNDARHLIVQAVVWGDGEDLLAQLPDGKQIGDSSGLYLDLDADQQPTPNLDRNYALNPWPFLPGLRYDIALGRGVTTTLKDDSTGRGAIRYVAMDDGRRVRVDTFAIPLNELGKRPGEKIRIGYCAYSRNPEEVLLSFGDKAGSEYFHLVTLAQRTTEFDITKLPNGREDAAPPSRPAPVSTEVPENGAAVETPAILTDGPFNYTVANGTITIAKYTGEGGDVMIPSAINGLPVASIGKGAFQGASLASVTIPFGVTNIGQRAFDYCRYLADLTIPNSVIHIGAAAFHSCRGLTSVTIPESVASIGWAAFYYTGLTNAAIGRGVTTIGNSVFDACTNLMEIRVAEDNLYYSSVNGVLFNKEKTKLIKFPEGRGGHYTLPSSVTSIGCTAFSACAGLTSVTVGRDVTSIDFRAFYSSQRLREIYFFGDAPHLAEDVFLGALNSTIHYLPGTTGWGAEFGGRPTALWNPQAANARSSAGGAQEKTIQQGTTPSYSDRRVERQRHMNQEQQPSGSQAQEATAAAESPAPAETDPYQFSCTANNGTVAIVRYTGEGGDINIPANISGLPVTSIQNEAFLNCANVTSVVIPNSVTSIGRATFMNCTGLTKVTIGNRVADLGDESFVGCSKLSRVMLPASVTRIGWASFAGCSELASILVNPLNPNYSSSTDGVLFNKEKTSLLCYPGGRVGSYKIPDSINIIDDGSFRGCSKLTSVHIPANVSGFNPNAFYDCSGLTSIVVNAGNPNFSSEDGVVFSKDKTTLFRYPSGRAGDYAIPTGVTLIGARAFEGSPGLTGVTIPNGVNALRYSSFMNCPNLVRVSIPNSVTRIEAYAFRSCRSLKEVVIPNSVNSIECDAFHGCSSLASVTFSTNLTRIDAWSFSDCAQLTSLTIPDGITRIENDAFNSCAGLTNVIIGGDVASIGTAAFSGCSSLVNVVLPGSLVTIGAHAFSHCTSLTSLSIPDHVADIGEWAFDYCTSLTTVRMPGGVNNIGDNAFAFCYGLRHIYFKGNAPRIGRDALRDDGNTTVYYVPGTTGWGKEFGGRPTAVWDPKNPFNYATTNGVATIVHYTGPGGAITVPGTINNLPVTSIGDNAFANCASLTSVTIPDGVACIGGWAFCRCSGLTRVSLPASVSTLVDSAFIYCVGLTSIVVNTSNPAYRSGPDGSVFNKDGTRLVCYLGGKMGSYAVPAGVTEIGHCAFQGCDKLTNLVLPASVERIGSYAFSDCASLSGIYVEGNAPSFIGNPFDGTTKATIYYRPGTTGWGAEFGGRPTAVWEEADAVASLDGAGERS